jgi:uncharacterized repeat protein (TIGR01451 family)
MCKFLAASVSVMTLIGATVLTQQLPLLAQLQPSPSGAAIQSPAAKRVVLTLKAEKQMKEGDKIVYQPTSGKSVKPGDVLRYTVTAKTGDKAVKNLILTQPIPRGTSYLKDSASNIKGAELLFSIDKGKSYIAKPMVGKKEAPTSTYTNIQWKLPGTIAAKAQVNATYEVKVN